MMRVLYLTMNPNRASTTVPTEGWFRCLREKGLEPVVASNTAGDFIAWARAEGVPAFHIPLPMPSKANPLPLARSLWRLRQLVKRFAIQLIHCNEQNIYPAGQYLARLCRLPVVVSVHCAMNRGFSEWAFAGRRQPDRIFFISPGNLEACRPSVEGVVETPRWRMLLNGLDLEHFLPNAERRARFRAQYALGDAPLIGVACALREGKQLEHLFAAAARLTVPGLRVVLAGGAVPDERAYAEALLETGKQLLGEKLLCLGHLSELRDFYNGIDIFVNTSRQEACSISVLEAMACGCPVIGYPSKSVDFQVMPDGGEIVPQDNVEALVDCIQNWLTDSQKLAGGRVGARARVVRDFDIRMLSDTLWREYENLIDSRKEPNCS